MANIDNINFSVIIDDKEFNKKIKEMEDTAVKFNTNLTNALKIQGELVDTDMIRSISKMISDLADGYKNMAKDAKESADIQNKSLEQTAEAVQKVTEAKKLAVKAQADMVAGAQLSNGEIVGNGDSNISNSQKKLDLIKQINIQIEKLKSLEEEINVIQEIRKEKGGGLANEYNNAVKEAERVVNVIRTLKQTQESLNVNQPNFGEQARSLSQQNITLKQMGAEYAAMEKKSQEAAKAQAKALKEAEMAAKAEAAAQAKAVKEAEKAAKATEKAAKEAERQAKANQKAAESAQKMSEEAERTSTQLGLANRSVNQFASLIRSSVSIYAVKRILESVITITGEFELQRTTLRAILQDVNKADAIFSRIKDLALVSPFNFKDLISYTKQLSAFSVPVEELYDTTKMLADMSAGLGVGMDRLILAYGQVRSASFLRGQEVRQFTEAGVPILEALKNEFVALGEEGITVGQVFDKISARQVPFEMVKKVLVDMTSEGGKFFNMQEVQAETLKGKLSNLKDAYQIFLDKVGSGMSGFLKGSVDYLRKLMENYQQIGRVILELVSTYGVYKVTLATVTALEKAHNMTMLGSNSTAAANLLIKQRISLLGKQLKSLKMIKALSNPYVSIAAGVAGLSLLLYKSITYQTEYEKSLKGISKITDKYNASVNNEISGLSYLFDRLKKAKVGTEEYEEVRKRISSEYGEYLTQQDAEALKIGGLTTAYDNLKKSIIEANKEKFLQEGLADIKKSYSNQFSDITNIFKELTGNLDKGTRQALSDYVLRSLPFDKLPEKAKQAYETFKRKVYQYTTSPTTGATLGVNTGRYENLLDNIKNSIKNLNDESQQLRDTLADNLNIAFGTEYISKTEAELSKFQKTVQGVLTSFRKDKNNVWWTDNTKNTSYYEYLSNLRSAWKDINDKIADAGKTQDEQIPKLKEELSIIEAIAKSLGINLGTKKTTGESGKSGKSQEEKNLEAQAAAIKKVKDAYDTLSPYLTGSGMTKALKTLFPSVDESIINDIESYRKLIEDVADLLDKVGDESSKKAAENLRLSVGGNEAKDMADKLKAAQEYSDMMRKWLGEDFNLQGTGIGFDVSKIASDLNSAYTNVIKKRDDADKALRDAESNYTSRQYAKELELIRELYEKEMEYEKKLAQEKINNLAETYVKEKLFEKGIDMRDFSDKTLKQVSDMKDKINEIIGHINTNELDINTSSLKTAGLTVEKLVETLKELFNTKLGVATEEQIKKIRNTARIASSVVGQLGGEIKDLGNAFSNNTLIALGDIIDLTSEFADILLECDTVVSNIADGIYEAGDNLSDLLKSSDVLTMAIKVVLMMVKMVVNAFTRLAEEEERAEQAALKYKQALFEISRLGGFDTIFGEDKLGKAIRDTELLTSKLSDFKKMYESIYNYGFGDVLYSIMYQGILSKFTENGELNIEKLKAYLSEAGDFMSDEIRQTFENIVELYESTEEYLSGIYDNLADNIAEKWVDSFIEIGDAATDMGNLVGDIAKQMAIDLIKSVVLMPIIEEYKKKAEEVVNKMSTGDISPEEGALALTQIAQEMTDTAEAQYKVVNGILTGFEDYFNQSEESSSNMISGVTEETAQLLSSYINAMRAELARQGMKIDQIETYVKAIATMFSSVPNLSEYLTKIEAHTQNIATDTRSILLRLESVTTTEGGQPAFRIID